MTCSILDSTQAVVQDLYEIKRRMRDMIDLHRPVHGSSEDVLWRAAMQAMHAAIRHVEDGHVFIFTSALYTK